MENGKAGPERRGGAEPQRYGTQEKNTMPEQPAVGLDAEGNAVLLDGKLTFQTSWMGDYKAESGEPLEFTAGDRLPDCCRVHPADDGLALTPNENTANTRARLVIAAGGEIGPIGTHEGDVLTVKLETAGAVDLEVSGYRLTCCASRSCVGTVPPTGAAAPRTGGSSAAGAHSGPPPCSRPPGYGFPCPGVSYPGSPTRPSQSTFPAPSIRIPRPCSGLFPG